MDNLENNNNIKNMDNLEMCELVAKAINFLTENNNEAGQDYLSIATAEGIIPGTRIHIKKFVLQTYNDLVKTNKKITNMNNPLYRLRYPNFDYEILEPLLKYFDDEKKCLISLKKLLNANLHFPTASFTGVFTSTLVHIHNVNIDKINKIIDVTSGVKNGPFSITLPDSFVTPENKDLVCEINNTVDKFLIKNKRL